LDRSEIAEELEYISGRLRKLLRRLRHEDWGGTAELEKILVTLDALREVVG